MDEKTTKTVGIKRRGARGEGSISKRRDGSWQAALSLGWDGAGKRVRQTVYGKTQREVRDKLQGLRKDRSEGKKPASGRTVGEYLTAWLETIQNRAPKTVTHYEYAVNSRLIPGLGAIKLEALTTDDVAGMLRKCSALSTRTEHHFLIVLRTALTAAVNDGLIGRNVAARKGLGRRLTRTRPSVAISASDAQRLLTAAKGDRLEALYVAALKLGPRQEDLLGLRWQDIDFGRGTVRIAGSLQRVKGKLTRLDFGKTKGTLRMLDMSAPLAATFAAHRDRQEAEQALAAGDWQAEPDLVFRTVRGRPLDGPTVTKMFQRGPLAAAGLPHMTFHDLRHSATTIMLQAGIGAEVVSAQVGHSSVAFTLSHYAHVMPAGRAAAAEAMDRALGG